MSIRRLGRPAHSRASVTAVCWQPCSAVGPQTAPSAALNGPRVEPTFSQKAWATRSGRNSVTA
eukprot:564086-Lingulodinium_polyedra.AAC.1